MESLYANEWTLTKSPYGAHQFEAVDGALEYPNPFNDTFRKASMLVSDIALREDPEYGVITKAWSEDLTLLETAFANAWCKFRPI